ncbi:MAG TPA: mucoidy inhibitor MuiA family protein, partial [Myxococcus sp.]|nr:mucoidy inhibitor MuiA family protein [Myxococcus sp.]
MLLFGLGLVAAGLVHASTEAPITAVTVYSDRARVVRTATLNVSGTQRVELPRLPDLVDPDSIRVEAQGAEVSSVDVRPASAPPFPEADARKLLEALDGLDASILRLESESAAYKSQALAMRRVQPVVPEDAARAGPRNAAPAAWSTAAAFLVDTTAKLEQRVLELDSRVRALKAERQRKLDEAGRLGERPRKPGIEVAVTLAGTGAAKLQLTYMVPQRVRWYPRYELQLQPEHQRVQVAFSGNVSQDTGEDWNDAKLILSTALPSNATALPRLATWKLGTAERFIPEPVRRRELAGAPPPLPPRAQELDLEYELRWKLLSRAGKPIPTREQFAAQQQQAAAASAHSFEALAAQAPPYSPPPQPQSSSQSYSGSNRGATINGGRGNLLGLVIDAQTRQPVPDVVVTATSPAFHGEETVVTDAQGLYRIPFLPQGVYTLRFEKEQHRPYARSDITLRTDHTLRINVELLPESLGESVEIVGAPPSIDVGSIQQGVGFSLHGP